MNPQHYIQNLETILNEYRFKEVGLLTDNIDPSEFNKDEIKKTLGLIRRKQLFPELEKAASLFYMSGHKEPLVCRQWAQALLDQGRITQGLITLRIMENEVQSDTNEQMEIGGLIGRAYKQLYVDEGNPKNLSNAIQAYQPGWLDRQGDYRWHGINLAALLARAYKDDVHIQFDEKMVDIASSIRTDIENLGHKAAVWDYGTAMEASVALDDQDGAFRWAKKYTTHPEVDAFELASSLRQLKEVWQLEETSLGKKLIPVLEYELLQRKGGELTPTASTVVDPAGFEAVYGPEGYVHVEWMDAMYKSITSVARISDSITGKCEGTGFLLKGSQLNRAWGDEPIFVTNSHVISSNPADGAPLQPEDASAEFTRVDTRPKVKLGELLFSSPKIECDISVFRIKPPVGAEILKVSFFSPVVSNEGDKPQRIFVAGHPKGAELAISLFDNNLVGYEGPYVHYRSPTDGGSSGSPVFNRKWKPFALHHRARVELDVNEGVLFEAIRNAVAL